VENIWDFSNLKPEEKDDPANLKLEVSKLINDVSSTAPDFHFEIKESYTFAEATRNLKTHMIKLFINKLAPKDLVVYVKQCPTFFIE
jgi:hypothetical protein